MKPKGNIKHEKKFKVFKLLINIVFIGGIAYFISGIIKTQKFNQEWEDSTIVKERIIGEILEFKTGARITPSFVYVFKFNGQSFKSSDFLPEGYGYSDKEYLKNFEGRKVSIEVVRSNPENSRIVFEELDTIFFKPPKKK